MPSLLKPVYKSLEGAGYKRAFLKRVALPQWWDDDDAHGSSGKDEVLLLLASRLGVKAGALRGPRPVVELACAPNAKFYRRDAGDSEDALEKSRRVATHAVRLALRSLPQIQDEVPSAAALRQRLIQDAPEDKPWVGFDPLVAWCWGAGIPVLHIPQFGTSAKRMEGMVVRLAGRFGIVLTSRNASSAWILFHLAHELGHIHNGDLPEEDGALVDGDIAEMDDLDLGDEPEEERMANAFATQLLTGGSNTLVAGLKKMRGDTLAQKAIDLSYDRHVDPSVLVLQDAHRCSERDPERKDIFWKRANKALACLQDSPAPVAILHDYLRSRLDLERLSDDDADYLRALTGIHP